MIVFEVVVGAKAVATGGEIEGEEVVDAPIITIAV